MPGGGTKNEKRNQRILRNHFSLQSGCCSPADRPLLLAAPRQYRKTGEGRGEEGLPSQKAGQAGRLSRDLTPIIFKVRKISRTFFNA